MSIQTERSELKGRIYQAGYLLIKLENMKDSPIELIISAFQDEVDSLKDLEKRPTRTPGDDMWPEAKV